MAERPDDHSKQNTTPADSVAGVSTRAVWYALGAIMLAGVVALGVLTWLWRTGRLPGIDDVTDFPGDQIAALAGMLPTGAAEPLVAPRSVSCDGTFIYVTEPDAHRISVFTVNGRFIRRIAIDEAGGGYPVDAAAIGDRLYVIDAAHSRVLAVPAKGGQPKRIAANLKRPTAVVADGSALLVADAESGIWRFESDTAEPELVAGPPSTRGSTGGMALDDDRLLVSDMGGSRVLDVAREGGDIRAFGERVNLPRGVAVDGSGRVWVADVLGGVVDVFDRSGSRLGELEDGILAGPKNAAIESPQGIAYDLRSRRMFVVDSARGRVFVYGVER